MNKFIKSDLEAAEKYMKAAIMNALNDIDTGEEDKIVFGQNLSWNLFNKCLEEAKWKHNLRVDFDTDGYEYWTSPSGKYCCIQGSLNCGQNYEIIVYED